MKKSILIMAIILSSMEFNGQINRINHYVPGTKVSLFPDQCGEELAEAEGKLSFCRWGDLGIVDQSFGLSGFSTKKMVTNHFNNDRVFITNDGISIHKEDGSWQNIPHRAIPASSTATSGAVQPIKNALLLEDGKMLITGIAFGPRLALYDMMENEVSFVYLPGDPPYSVIDMVYDADRDLTWVFCRTGSDNFLYKYENEELTLVYEMVDDQVVSNSEFDTYAYSNNRLYICTPNGLTIIEIELDGTFTETKHSESVSGTLLYDRCNEIEVDNEGFIWFTQVSNDWGEGALIQYDPTNETFQFYQLENPAEPSAFVPFMSVGQDRNTGLLWLKSNALSGLVNLQIVDEQPVWNNVTVDDFEALGVAISPIMGSITTQGAATYFCTYYFTGMPNANDEVLVLSEGVWSGINEDEEGNLASRSLYRFHGSYADDDGGVWWLNKEENDLTYIKNENEFDHQINYDCYSEKVACMGQNQNLIIGTEEGFGALSETGFLPYENSSFTDPPTMSRAWSNEVWTATTEFVSPQNIVRYINGEVIQEFETDELEYYYHFTMTTDKKGVFVQSIATSELVVKIFDAENGEFSDLIYSGGIGSIRDILSAEDGNFWIIAEESILFYNGSDFELYDSFNLDGTAINGANQINSAVLDQDQNLHFILERGQLYTMATPYDNFEIETSYTIGGPDGLMPYFPFFEEGFDHLAIDADGDLWLAKEGSLIELQRENGVPEFNVNDIVGVNELLKDDVDFEMFPNPNSTGQLSVIIPENFGQSNLSIYDLQGKLIASVEIQRSRTEIELTDVSSGMYIVNISNVDHSVSKKLIIK